MTETLTPECAVAADVAADNIKPLADLLPNGDRYQVGIRPGSRKLAQIRECLTVRRTPALYAQDGKGDNAIAYVKIFDPCGRYTCYITEWDGDQQIAFGLVDEELGYIGLEELATHRGRLGVGLEIDMHFLPSRIGDLRKE